MGLESIPVLVGLALACGAADAGGPLSPDEIALVSTAAPVARSQARRVAAGIRDGADPLGAALCELRPAAERRALGAFYTGDEILEPMVAWAFEQRPKRFVDPGCGSGRFAAAAARRNSRLEIVAVDLDPLATLLTRAALAVVGAKRARVLQADYVTAEIPRFGGRTAFVGNPPYVRHHDLGPATKAYAERLARKAGHRVSGLAGLHALFYLATLAKHGAEGDVGSFVTSAEWLDVAYGSIVRSMFTNGLGGRSLTVFDPTAVPFDDAMTTAAITTFVIGEQPRSARIARITGEPRASASVRRTVAARRRFVLEGDGRDVERDALARAERWSAFVHGRVELATGDTIGTHFRVSRGQVTGANGFFVMTRREARERGIERFCVPVVSAADEVFASGGVVRDAPERLVALEVPKDLDVTRFPRLRAYLRAGEAEGVHEGYVSARRSPWWSVAYPRPPIVATYMARQPPAFAANPDRLGLLNIAHGLHPRAPMDDAAIARVVATLNENRATFAGRGRTYHGGLEKFEPGEMEALPLGDPR